MREFFSQYYRSAQLSVPDLLSSREIGFIPFGGSMVRHQTLKSKDEMKEFILRRVPRHLYHSTAYYRDPGNRIMKLKRWLGAELVFDLDADHIPGSEENSYSETLRTVKEHTIRLVFRFLLDDMGFSEDEISIFFSGGRGYHVHVLSDKVYTLGSDSRREISNYIRGEGLLERSIIYELKRPGGTDSGWYRAVDSHFTQLYRDIIRGDQDSLEFLQGCLKNAGSVRAFINSLKRAVVSGNFRVKKENLFTKEGQEKYSMLDVRDEAILMCVVKSVVGEYASEIDEPVTTDVHRLIRFPGSLHGKTGLMVKNIGIHELKDFDPLTEAVPEQFKDGQVSIVGLRDFEFEIMGSPFRIRKNEALEVPVFASLFAVGQRGAKFMQ